jgi:hypothetical protein
MSLMALRLKNIPNMEQNGTPLPILTKCAELCSAHGVGRTCNHLVINDGIFRHWNGIPAAALHLKPVFHPAEV